MPAAYPSGPVGPGAVPQPAIWGDVPLPNANFTGRHTELATLRDALTRTPGTTVLWALQGLSGVGKTQLAVEYAYRYAAEYDIVWWIPADSPELIRANLAALGQRLGLGPAGVGAEAIVLDALRRGEPYARWLVVFDNADQPETTEDLLPRGPGHVLVTTRNARWRGRAATLEIDVFPRVESAAFLARRVPGLPESDCDRLAEELGDLPLALEQAGALLAETGMPPGDYIELLRQRASEMLGEGLPTGYPMSVAAAWAVSVENVRKAQPDAVELLNRLAFFGAGPIARGLLSEHRLPIPGELDQTLARPERLARALRELSRFGIVRLDLVKRNIEIHRLTQAMLRDALPPDDEFRLRHDVHCMLAGADPGDPDDPVSWERYADMLRHLRPSRVAECRSPEVRRFVLNMVSYLYIQGEYLIGRDIARTAITRWTQDTAAGPDDRDVLVMSRQLAVILLGLGEYSTAFELNEDTLARMRRVLRDEPEQVLRATNTRGGLLRAIGRFAEARQTDEESLPEHIRVFGADHQRTSVVRHNLAIDLRLTSDYAAALALDADVYRQRLAIYRHEDNPWVLWSHNNLARDQRERGDYAESLRTEERIFALYRKVFSEDHPEVLRAEKNLSVSSRKAGDHVGARGLALDVYARYVRRYGPDHPDTLAAANNLINDDRLAGELAPARARGEDTLAGYRRILGDRHPFTRGCALNLAIVLRRLGTVDAALQLNEETVAGLRESIGEDHHYTLSAAVNLASDLAAAGQLAQARELGRDTRTRLAKMMGEDHPYTLACAANLALDLRALGDAAAAELAAQSLAALSDRLGREHPDTVAASAGERLDCDFEPPPI